MESVKDFKTKILKKLSNSSDVLTRELTLSKDTPALVVWINNIVDNIRLDESFIKPLLLIDVAEGDLSIDYIAKNIECVVQNEICKSLEYAIKMMLKGYACLFIEGKNEFLLVNLANFKTRGIEEPPTSVVLKGPREGFVESMNINLMLIRKRLMTPKLKIDEMQIGKYTESNVCIVYISTIADLNIVKSIKKKLKKIDIDGIISSFYLQQFLEEKPYSLFKQMGSTEKPDVLASKLLEGRIAILVNGSPIAITIPYLLLEDIQSSNDYYFSRNMRVSFLRHLRLIGVILAIFLPGIYVATQVYHYKILPLKFLITISNTSQGIPFTPLIEVLFIVLLFEALYEASLRMPRYIGLALSVVGALILGETAVNAGLVSSPAVMIVALTGVVLYTVPDQESQLSMLRIIYTIIGGLLGLYGIIITAVFLIAYLVNFTSYSTPYLAPIAPNIKSDKKDGINKKSIVDMRTRPKSIPNQDLVRLRRKK